DGIHGAKSNDSSTWHSFEEVAAACQSLNAKNRRRDVRYLPGFMMGAGYCGLDFDGCLQGSELNEKVRELMEKFDGAYFEVSVSGRGIRGFIKAKKLFSSCDYLIDEGVVLEIYDKGRFFVCTGSSFNNDKVTISDCQTVLDEICKELGETDEPVPPSKAEKEYSNDEAPTEEEVEELKEALKALPFDEYFGNGTYSNGNWRNVRFALQWRFIKDRDVGIALMDKASSGTLHGVPAPESYIGYKDIEERWDDHNTAKHINPITIGWLFDKARNYGFDINKFRSNRLLDKLKSRQTTAPSFNENLSEFTSTVLPEPMIKYNDLWRGWLIAKAYCTENRFVLE
ncbi:MAG TPA: hypothetical protein VJ508_00125, partial [Saprospiraceae bacterium]|nr:hypothetical protein [Saprospiraceae bacterium]